MWNALSEKSRETWERRCGFRCYRCWSIVRSPKSVAMVRWNEEISFLLQKSNRIVWKCPGGTIENSPALQRRVHDQSGSSPEGTADAGLSLSRPFGTRSLARLCPALKRRAILNCPSGAECQFEF